MQRNIIISGASSGIGLAIAKKFCTTGDKVFNLDIKSGEYGEHIYCDLREHTQVVEAVNTIAKSHCIDVVISNAGMHYSGTIEDTTEQAFMSVFDLNVKGAYSLVHSAITHMKPNNSGVILFIGSDQSIVGKPTSFAYNLSKHCLASMAKTTALDYAAYNIRANALCPGTVETPLYHKAINSYCDKTGADPQLIHQEEASLQPLNRIGQPEDVATMAYFLASDDASFITGSLHSIDGGYTAK